MGKAHKGQQKYILVHIPRYTSQKYIFIYINPYIYTVLKALPTFANVNHPLVIKGPHLRISHNKCSGATDSCTTVDH